MRNGRKCSVAPRICRPLWRPFLKDPDDDFILELAFAAGARYIVTHNTRDFAGSDQLGIQAMTPGDFYRLVFHKP